MLTTTQNRHKIILEAYKELLTELAAAGKQGAYGNYEMAEIIAERIGRIYESDYVYNVIFRPHIFAQQEANTRQLQLFNTTNDYEMKQRT
jgi:hypothetical protein